MKVIVLTPIKNEEWILDNFLSSCSLFADHIIIADQNSTDKSAEIALKYEKVILIKNGSQDFNEGDRQKLLIQKARELFGLGNFLVALDADEIISSDSLHSQDWQKIRDAELGTVFLFDKPTPLFNLQLAFRYPKGFPLGFVDDGSEHNPSEIHSRRVPTPQNCTEIFLENILFMHLCFVRENVQFSKNRYYCCLEKIQNKRKLSARRLFYRFLVPKDYIKIGGTSPINSNWYSIYNAMGINLKKFKEEAYYYMDFEVLILFTKYGTKAFYNEPIWHFDWESCRIEGLKRGIEGIPSTPIKMPSRIHRCSINLYYNFVNFITLIWRKIRTR